VPPDEFLAGLTGGEDAVGAKEGAGLGEVESPAWIRKRVESWKAYSRPSLLTLVVRTGARRSQPSMRPPVESVGLL